MNYAVIAAGKGDRLVQEGVALPKPLVEVDGISLLDRLIAVFSRNNASAVSIIVNEEMEAVRKHIEQLKTDFPIRLVVRSTLSSMHSFFELSPFLKDGKFCLTTVDTVFKEAEFAVFIRAFEADNENDGMMVVTPFIDDEKPLYVSVNENSGMIIGFGDDENNVGNVGNVRKYVSGGIYGLTPTAILTLNHCVDAGMSRMRNFQRQLIEDGLKLKAYPFEKMIDVDHVSDIAKAEDLLANRLNVKLKIAGIRRDEPFFSKSYSGRCGYF